ncbi:MAG TPA: hypothetical protein VN958_17500 [Chitinophagaceae bacterium]|nr:hypothetical protein [Chitinophagaceae bacterium]
METANCKLKTGKVWKIFHTLASFPLSLLWQDFYSYYDLYVVLSILIDILDHGLIDAIGEEIFYWYE